MLNPIEKFKVKIFSHEQGLESLIFNVSSFLTIDYLAIRLGQQLAENG